MSRYVCKCVCVRVCVSEREGGRDGGRERERARARLCVSTHTHTYTHAHTNVTCENVQELRLTNAQFRSMLSELKKGGWTDRRTRCVLFDTTIYNVELNTFLNIRIAFEFQPHGFVGSFVSHRAVRMGFVR